MFLFLAENIKNYRSSRFAYPFYSSHSIINIKLQILYEAPANQEHKMSKGCERHGTF